MLALIILSLVLIVAILFGGFHIVDEGTIGIYYTNGVLQQSISEPGFHFMIPLLTRVENIQINVQTDLVQNIPCGTSGGVMIFFDKIEVVNQLQKQYVIQTVRNYTSKYDQTWINDKIHHEINQFCSIHTLQEIYIDKFEQLDEELQNRLQKILNVWVPGLNILGIRITKPRIPTKIKQAFESMEQERNELIIMENKRNVRIQEAFTNQISETIKAKSELEVAQINVNKQITEAESKYKVAQIQNQMLLQKESSAANSTYYSAIKELETQEQKFTEKYMQYLAIDALLSEVSITIGNKIPTYLLNQAKNFWKNQCSVGKE